MKEAETYLFFNNKIEGQVRPMSWLVKKFLPLPGWSDEDIKRLEESEKTTWN
jgi:hypothetical protein